MGVRIKFSKDTHGNSVRLGNWYGEYVGRDGKRRCVNLNVPITGRDGSKAFNASKAAALEELQRIQNARDDAKATQGKARAIFREMTGKEISNPTLAELPGLLPGESRWDKYKGKLVSDFAQWGHLHDLGFVRDVDKEKAAEYIRELYERGGVTFATVGKMAAALQSVFGNVLADGEPNPFKGVMRFVKRMDGDIEIHRTPLTEEEIGRLISASREDRTAHDLIVCGLCTALRRGDACRLKWADVNLGAADGGFIHVQTHKTAAEVTIPIFGALRSVLLDRQTEAKRGAVYVFPEAAEMIETNPDGITYRIKKVFASAFPTVGEFVDVAAIDESEGTTPAEALPRVLSAIEGASMIKAKRERMKAVMSLYAEGKTYREIMTAANVCKGSVSGLLHEAEQLSGLRFLPRNDNCKTKIADATRAARKVGRAASVRDFHSLRTTFVTLAVKNGVTLEKVTAITGHATVKTAMEHYMQTKGTDFTADFEKALPKVLTHDEIEDAKDIREAGTDKIAALLDRLAAVLKDVAQLTPEERREFSSRAAALKLA